VTSREVGRSYTSPAWSNAPRAWDRLQPVQILCIWYDAALPSTTDIVSGSDCRTDRPGSPVAMSDSVTAPARPCKYESPLPSSPARPRLRCAFATSISTPNAGRHHIACLLSGRADLG
jgi:hypothetical protein